MEKIKNNTNFKKIFIPYEPADAGGSIGSALTKYYLLNQNKKKYQPNPFLGIKYQIQDIEKLLISEEKKNKIIFEKIDDKKILCYKKTAKLISDNKIIAWFQDRMEFGPRALGNRSILMDARNKNAKEILNSKVKLRENYRPFAPSILKEEVEKWFEFGDAADYMTFVYKILENKRHLIPAVCHVDGTGRVQTVDKKINPTYYELIKSFYDITNVPLIINTSYNENEPIVNDPSDALETFLKTNLDYLVIENFYS